MSENRKVSRVFGKVGTTSRQNPLAEATHLYESLWAGNSSGDWFKLPPQSVLVIYDDMDCHGEDSPTLIWFSWGTMA